MPNFRFKVTLKEEAKDRRGLPMRRLVLEAVESDAFRSDAPLPKGLTPAPPRGVIDADVSASFAKAFDIGDEFDLIPRERR
jgi:hypothetical protein